MVFQSYALYPHMSAYQNLAFGLENARLPRAEIEARVMRAARMLQIEPLLGRKPRQLSGGQRQRVAIGRAITRDPRIFLFDEPLSNLDAELRVQMRVELSKLHKELGATMIYVTHDQVEAMTMADRIVVLREGRLEQAGRPLDIYNRPANRFVAGFIGSPRMNFLHGTVASARADCIEVQCPGLPPLTVAATAGGLIPGADVTVGIRPEHLAIGGDGGWPLAVEVVEQLGGASYVHGRLPGGERITVAETGQTPLRSGETALATPLPGRVHVFRADGGEAALAATDRIEAERAA
jgi:ABC-type sugar transport system ATPase subunit